MVIKAYIMLIFCSYLSKFGEKTTAHIRAAICRHHESLSRSVADTQTAASAPARADVIQVAISAE